MGIKSLPVPCRMTKRSTSLISNHKKVYRLCKELNVLQPQRIIKPKYPRKLAKKTKITGSNQLWQMDLKYAYIPGIDRFFFIMSIIDVYDRCIVGYHIGLRALAVDALRVLRQALIARGVTNRRWTRTSYRQRPSIRCS